MTRLGVQPARNVIHDRQLTIAGVADDMGIPRNRLYNVLNGLTAATVNERRALSRILRTAQKRLFTSEALEAEAREYTTSSKPRTHRSHADCDHPTTPKARAVCRAERNAR